MTSEYDNGPQLFDVDTQDTPSSESVKPAKRVVVKKNAEAVPSADAESSPSSDDAQTIVQTPPTPPKRRGRPPKTAKKEAEVKPEEQKSSQTDSVAGAQKKQKAVQKSETPSSADSQVVPETPERRKAHDETGKSDDNGRSENSGRQENKSSSRQNNNSMNSSNRRQSRQKNTGRQKNSNTNNNNNFQKNRKNNRISQETNVVELFVPDPSVPSITVNDISVLTLPEMRRRAKDFGLSDSDILDYKKQDLIVEILKAHTQSGGVIMAYGALEILPDGYGFLRSPHNNYLSGTEDIYISISQVKSLSLKTGDTVRCQIRPPKDAERYFAMIRVESINFDPPEASRIRAAFDSLTPLYPDSRLNLETEDPDISTRIINLFAPIGKGQRSLIVAPPRAGKTILMQKIANAITTNHPEVYLMVLLIDERPEEVTDMRRTVKGEVIASTFDEQASRHVTVAEMVIEKAKRLVEHKRDVVILLDNITRLARAYNQTVPASGKILSGGVDSNALHRPKRFLGAARNIEHGGSLTIIANALIETGSRMDEVIFEEFKGTGNNEIVLDRRMAERRLYPAINIKKSGTRREDLLLAEDENMKIWALRNAINPMEDLEMTQFLVDKMKKTKNNEAFLRSMNTSMM